MPSTLPSAFAAGILSAGLFLFVGALGLGFFFMFLPTLPLLYAGLSGKAPVALSASAIAAVIITLMAGPAGAVVFLFFLGLPSWYIGRQALKGYVDSEGRRHWFPMGRIFLDLVLAACAFIALMTVYYTGVDGGIAGMLSEQIHEGFAYLEPEYGDAVNRLADQLAFLIFAVTVWLWALVLYAHAWFANRLLARNEKTIRPDMAVDLFMPPNWLLSLLAIGALASLIGSPSMQLLAKSTVISLMLPYFLLGAARMHAASQAWPSRRFFLFLVYFTVFTMLWPALALAAFGFFYHIKHLSGGSSSSTS